MVTFTTIQDDSSSIALSANMNDNGTYYMPSLAIKYASGEVMAESIDSEEWLIRLQENLECGNLEDETVIDILQELKHTELQYPTQGLLILSNILIKAKQLGMFKNEEF